MPYLKKGSGPFSILVTEILNLRDCSQRENPDAGRHRLSELLARHQGNVRAAADALGVSRSTLYGRLARSGLDPAAFRPR